MDDKDSLEIVLVQLAKLFIHGTDQDIRLFIARIIRKYRNSITYPHLSQSLNKLLQDRPEGRSGVLRSGEKSSPQETDLPACLLGPSTDKITTQLVFSEELQNQFTQILQEFKLIERLKSKGIKPSSSMIFIGAPGVGKTLSAHWLSEQLSIPLYILDLASVMSSFLGQTGLNLKQAISYAKSQPSILLLDEIDALAKKRSDETDVGELKRIVNVLLQEIEDWPAGCILIAATNHSELVDPALWRRFDHIIHFPLPNEQLILQSFPIFFEDDFSVFESFQDILTILFEDKSYSDIKREVLNFRRQLIVNDSKPEEIIFNFVQDTIIDRKKRIEIAKVMTTKSLWSQHKISELTGVSRDTLRKHTKKDIAKAGVLDA